MEIKEISSTSLFLFIPHNPQPLPRPRFCRGIFINPVSSVQKKLATQFRFLLPLETSFPFWENHPLCIDFVFSFALPQSWSKKKKKAFSFTPYLKTPDLDNMIKFYLDTFNGVLYSDDKQIYSLNATKQWSHSAFEGYVEMKIKLQGEDNATTSDV